MQMKMFSIRDRAVEAFNTPFFMLTKAEAIRALTNLVKDPETKVSHNPQDYDLYYLGVWDNISGDFEGANENLGCAATFKEKENIVEMRKQIEEQG